MANRRDGADQSLNNEIGLQRARGFDRLKDRDDPRRLDADPIQTTHQHTQARSADDGDRPAGLLRIEVSDDGIGGADPALGTGLLGVERRLGTFDGILAVSSPPGGPTMVVMEVPCALSPATAASR